MPGVPGRRVQLVERGALARASTRARARAPRSRRSAPSRRRVYCRYRRSTHAPTGHDRRARSRPGRARLGPAKPRSGRSRYRFARPPPQGDRSKRRRACLSRERRGCVTTRGYAPAHERRARRARGAAVRDRAGRGAAAAGGLERARPGRGRGAARDPHRRAAGRGDDANARARRGAGARLLPLGRAAPRGARRCRTTSPRTPSRSTRPASTRARLQRSFYTSSSSCGVCGKGALDAVAVEAPRVESDADRAGRAASPRCPSGCAPRSRPSPRPAACTRPASSTPAGELLCLREDVGRHNAMDKVVGWAFREGRLPLAEAVLCLSGRLSFELVQKAAVAGCPILVAVGAPSSLAVELAARPWRHLVRLRSRRPAERLHASRGGRA